MKTFAETERIILRELVEADALAFYEMESDPEVHRYLGSTPIKHVEQAVETIRYVRQQYLDFGIGRWAIIDKQTSQFVGWGGMKFRQDLVNGHVNFYDVGYRLLRKFWGMGYATESAKASIAYAFEQMKLDAVYAMANVENAASIKALQKSGLRITAELTHEGIRCYWFEITRTDYKKLSPICGSFAQSCISLPNIK